MLATTLMTSVTWLVSMHRGLVCSFRHDRIVSSDYASDRLYIFAERGKAELTFTHVRYDKSILIFSKDRLRPGLDVDLYSLDNALPNVKQLTTNAAGYLTAIGIGYGMVPSYMATGEWSVWFCFPLWLLAILALTLSVILLQPWKRDPVGIQRGFPLDSPEAGPAKCTSPEGKIYP